jgi:thiosulfate/3-mercaptopyruvate sulfurtransferase
MYTTLIEAGTLQAHHRDPNWIIVDCRFDLSQPDAGHEAYLAGHIPGALYFHLDQDMSAPRNEAINGGRHPLPSRENACRHFARRGIGNGRQVVAYDTAGGMFAARLWWMLRWIGHAQVAVLNGGLGAWETRSYPLQVGPELRPPARLDLNESLTEYIAVETVERNVQSKLRVHLDARAPDRFLGQNETLDPVAGHIPGAVNRFFKNNLNPDSSFKGATLLRQEFERISQGKPLIHQCGSGVSACHNILAMTYAGLPAGGLYAGSWSEWIEDHSRPVTTGN